MRSFASHLKKKKMTFTMEFFTVMEEVHLYHILSVSSGMLFPDFDGCKAFFPPLCLPRLLSRKVSFMCM